MSKRDDDSQSDMEVGMTTAERRRRRRRGGGLRVPSDNVPRRTTTPPVVAPVPEDPSLAMSIAYSFTTEAADGVPRATRDTPVPGFERRELMPTVIDPVSGPIEHADFEMDTREMSAVDLDALGLAEAGMSSNTIPVQRISSPRIEPITARPREVPGAGFKDREATEPVDDVDVEIDSSMEAGATLDQDPDEEPDEIEEPVDDDAGAELAEVDSAELSAIEAPTPPRRAEFLPTRPPGADAVSSRLPKTSSGGLRLGPPTVNHVRAQTVALSEEDLEEVREAKRLATQPSQASPPSQPSQPSPSPSSPPPSPPPRSASPSIPPPMPSAKPAEVKPSPPAEPASVPEIDIMALEDKAAESSGEFEVVVDGIAETGSGKVASPPAPAAQPEPRTRQPSPGPGPGPGHPPSSPTSRESQPMPLVRDPQHPPSSRESQPMPLVRDPQHAPPPLRDSQPVPLARDPQHASPPPPPVLHKAPPSPPPAKKVDKAPVPVPAAATPGAKAEGKPARGKPWFVDLFDEDYLRTLPFLTPQATQAEAEFVINAMGLSPGAQVLDVGCGYGRHAMELAARGFHVVGLDMSTPLLVRGGEEAHRRGLTINFVRGDMRELDFEAQFDGAYCLFSTFGYFDDETNKKTVANIARALRPGGRILIEILNRDYVIADLPTRVWWEGDGCVVLEEVDLNYFSSRIQVNRSVVFDDGRQLEQEISVRAYSLHEVGKLLHSAGFRVLEVSGGYHTRGRFFGNQSRHIIVLAERKDPAAT